MKNFNRGGRGMLYRQPFNTSLTNLISRCLLHNFRSSDKLEQVLHCGSRYKIGTQRNAGGKLVFLTIFCVLFSGLLVSPAYGQEANGLKKVEPVMVGHKVPDDFWTKEHLFYINGDTVRRSLEGYKGKILVLDFWATWCANCIGSMKKTQQLFAKYPEDALVLFVNPAQTKDNYTKILAKQDILRTNSLNGSFTSIIDDKLIQQLFPNHIYPRYVWISPFGNLMAQTTALSVTEGHLTEMISILKQFHGKE